MGNFLELDLQNLVIVRYYTWTDVSVQEFSFNTLLNLLYKWFILKKYYTLEKKMYIRYNNENKLMFQTRQLQ